MTEGEELTQRKSAHRDRALRVHRIGTPVMGISLWG